VTAYVSAKIGIYTVLNAPAEGWPGWADLQ